MPPPPGGGVGVVGALNYQPVVCWGPAVKSRGRGGCFVLNNLDIDFISGYFTHLLNLVWGFFVAMAPCWSDPCHVHAWEANVLTKGGGQRTSGQWDCL